MLEGVFCVKLSLCCTASRKTWREVGLKRLFRN